MDLLKTSIIFLLGSGVWYSQALTAAPAEPQSDTPAISAAGAKYEHRLEMSRFEVGDAVRHEVDGPYERVRGEKGAFLIDKVTGATLAVRNAPEVSKLSVASKIGGNDATQPVTHPQPLTENPDEHSAVARAYLLAAGLPKSEVSGTHITTTMAGRGPRTGGVQTAHVDL